MSWHIDADIVFFLYNYDRSVCDHCREHGHHREKHRILPEPPAVSRSVGKTASFEPAGQKGPVFLPDSESDVFGAQKADGVIGVKCDCARLITTFDRKVILVEVGG